MFYFIFLKGLLLIKLILVPILSASMKRSLVLKVKSISRFIVEFLRSVRATFHLILEPWIHESRLHRMGPGKPFPKSRWVQEYTWVEAEELYFCRGYWAKVSPQSPLSFSSHGIAKVAFSLILWPVDFSIHILTR